MRRFQLLKSEDVLPDIWKVYKVWLDLLGHSLQQAKNSKRCQIKFSLLWLTSLSRYERTASVSFNNATLHFPLRGREGGNTMLNRHRKSAVLDLSVHGWMSDYPWALPTDDDMYRPVCECLYCTWCVSQVDSHTVERGRALCDEAGVSVFLLSLSLSGSLSLLPTPLQRQTQEKLTSEHMLKKTPMLKMVSMFLFKWHRKHNSGLLVTDKLQTNRLSKSQMVSDKLIHLSLGFHTRPLNDSS